MKPEINENNKTQNKKISKKINIRHTIVVYLTIAVATLISVILLYTQVLINAVIPSDSMEDTLKVGDHIIGNRLSYKLGGDPKRTDIVIFYAPDLENTLYIKRIIGMPGDTVEIKNGKVYVNDEELDEPYIREEMEVEDDMIFHVPEDSYFMLGDNRNESLDSRYWDNPYVARNAIVAKAIFKYWKEFSTIK